MAGNKENIDQLFKKGLNQNKYEVPPAFLDDLEHKLDGMQRKRFGGLFWSVLFIGILNFILIGFLFFNYIDNTPTNGKSAQQALMVENGVESSSVKASGKSAVQLEVEDSIENLVNEVAEESEEVIKRVDTSLNEQKQAIDKNRVVLTPTPTEKRSYKKSIQKGGSGVNNEDKDQSNAKQKIKVDKTEIIAFEAGKTAPKENDLKESNVSKAKEESGHVKTGELTTWPHAETEQSQKEGQANEKIVNEEVEAPQEEAEIETEEVENTDEKTEEETTLPLAEDVDSIHPKQAPEEGVELGTKGLKDGFNPLTLDLQVYGGIGSVFYSDKLFSSAQFEGLGDVEDGREMMLVPSVGTNLNFNFKNLTFGIGAGYMQTGEKFSYDQLMLSFYDTTYTYTDTTTEEISYYQPYGDWIYDTIVEHIDTIVEDAVITDTTFEKTLIMNRYSWVSIPVSFGYRFKVGKFEIIPRIGAQFNIGVAQNKGRLPSENLEELIAFSATRFNVSYLGQVELRRNFTHWHVFVSPYVKSMINPAIKEDGFHRKYTNWGIQIGVGFKL